MKASIRDADALRAVSPSALAAYARAGGWKREASYRTHSDVYVGDSLPEIVIPRTAELGDYATAVATLIEIFAAVEDQEQLAVYQAVMTADRDVIRLRARESDNGSLALDEGVDLISGSRDLLLAAACSLSGTQAAYRAGANREASDLLKRVRLGQTDRGSFVVTLLTSVIPPAIPMLFDDDEDSNAPNDRLMTRRLAAALVAAREATERAAAGDGDAFIKTVEKGVSANLCEALVCIMKPFDALDIRVSWARARPLGSLSAAVRFGKADAPILSEAARSFRARVPRPDEELHGFVQILKRGEDDVDGTIKLVTRIDGKPQSVAAVLKQSDYERAVQAHSERAVVILKGDLERVGQRWKMMNPTLVDMISNH